MAYAVPITLEQMDQLLAPLGFTTINLPGTVEYVYAKAYRRYLLFGGTIPLSLRVYTSIAGDQSRDVGEDAIRVSLWTRNNTRIFMIRAHKRVHRVQHWRTNLLERLTHWETLLDPLCPKCYAPMLLRKPKAGATWKQFYGCIRHPECKGYLSA